LSEDGSNVKSTLAWISCIAVWAGVLNGLAINPHLGVSMKRLLTALTILTSALFASVALADQTNTQAIKQLRFNGDNDYFYVQGQAGWSATSCNPLFVVIHPWLSKRDKIFAMITAAHMAGKRVSFVGNCNTDPTYFDATYVIVED
jgi:hypothetical protein